MRKLPLAPVALSFAVTATLFLGGCSKQAPQQGATSAPQQQPATSSTPAVAQPQASQQQQATGGYAPQPGQASGPGGPGYAQGYAQGQQAARASAPPRPEVTTIPAGTHIRVTTREELGSKISQPGQSFSATVASPIVVRGVTLVRAGSTATGTVVDAKAEGRFKGSGELDLRLDSIHADGQTYEVDTSSIDQVEKGKGKRTAGFALGGGGGGALIGGLAGGGKGALLGGLLGAGGGTAVNAFTGNKQVVVPAETTLTFRLERAVTVR